ncbi:MAG: TiaS agmantine-binding domain-containing protein [Caldisphaera sp.]|jgi:tRNA(Ile2)-agmatinylcytidine synthase|nr:tRNA(Ile)(2)-agmatinylcytidine synthase [Caldisphaera sp.]PMP59487.1 MAG: hypothetical protein C0202_02440 [Caldisphaera sp.]
MNNKKIITISFDDVDSQYGGCTTHFTGIFLNYIKKNINLIDYPLLVRLNPGIPWKTRGNASTALRFIYDGNIKDLLDLAISFVEEYTTPRPPLPGKKPGIVITEGNSWEKETFKTLYKKAVSDVVTLDYVKKILEKEKAVYYGSKGLIGATAAQGALSLKEPYTFELIYYRLPDNWGKERCVNNDLILNIEKSLPNCVINNYDYIKNKTTAKPNGPDPILAGFRGTCNDLLWKYEKALCEPPHFAVLYRTNQHTNYGLENKIKPYPYRNVEVVGKVLKLKIIPKGHVIVTIDSDYGIYDIAFYKDTGPLNEASKLLNKGDVIKIIGLARPYRNDNLTIAAVSMEVLYIKQLYKDSSPRCPICGAKMKNLGINKGFKCIKCGFKDKNLKKTRIPIFRKLMPGIYSIESGELMHLQKEKYVKLPLLNKLSGFLNVDEAIKIINNP